MCGTIKRNLKKNKTRMETQISCIKYHPYLLATTAVTGVLTETDKRGIQASEMRFLKSTLGVTRQAN
jgi:hypothetical protein